MMLLRSSALILLTICLVFPGCGRNSEQGDAAPQVAQRPDEPVPVPGQAAAPPVIRKIIYTSQIEIVVENVAATELKLSSLIESIREHGGFLARQELSGMSGAHRRSLWTIRVPLRDFDAFVSKVEQLGELVRSSRETQDVTDAYTDLESRLRNKQSSEQRLLSHLEKTMQLKDTLELERELTRVRGEIEQMQGQLNLLKSKTDLATVSITITERAGFTPATAPAFTTLLGQTFRGSMRNLISFGQIVLLIAVAIGPWGMVLGLLFIPMWLLRRRQKGSIPATT